MGSLYCLYLLFAPLIFLYQYIYLYWVHEKKEPLFVGINSLYSQLGTIVYWRGHTAYLGTVWLIVRFFTFLHLIKAEEKALGTFQIPSHMRGGKTGSTLTGTSLCWSSSWGLFLTLWGDDTLGWSLSLVWAWGGEITFCFLFTLLTWFTLLILFTLLAWTFTTNTKNYKTQIKQVCAKTVSTTIDTWSQLLTYSAATGEMMSCTQVKIKLHEVEIWLYSTFEIDLRSSPSRRSWATHRRRSHHHRSRPLPSS